MAYVTPKVLVQQEFTQVPNYAEFPLPAFIIGPNYSLLRYNEALEKQLTAVVNPDDSVLANKYQYLLDVTYSFPNVPAGGNVDHDYTKVFAEAVEALYFPNASLGSDSGDAAVTKVLADNGSTHTNRVRFSTVNLVSTSVADRDAVFSERDVKIGDVIEVTDNLGNVLKSKIKGLHADTPKTVGDSSLDATVGVALLTGSNGASNNTTTFTGTSFTAAMVGQYITITGKGTYKIIGYNSATSVSLSAVVTGTASNLTYKVGGIYNDVANVGVQTEDFNNAPTYTWLGIGEQLATGVTVLNSSTNYAGYPAARIMSDTYTVVVTEGTSLATAKFSVSSAAGAFVTKTDVAIAADILVVDDTDANDIQLDFSDTTAFVVGQSWSFTVTAGAALVNPTVALSTSTFTAPVDLVYKLTVVRGGAFYNGSTNADTCAKVTITSSDVDSSAAVLVREDVPFRVGNYGLTATFADGSAGGGLITGDVYYIATTAAKIGAVKIVELSDNLGESSLNLASTFTAKLFLTQTSIEIPSLRDLVDETVNWSQEDNYITINAGITTYVTNLLASAEPVRLPVVAAKLFVQHRDLLQNNVNSISGVRSASSVAALLGKIHPDNPLAQGVYDAALNSANQIVYFIGVATDDLAGYNAAIEIAKKNDKVYSFVPMTFDRSIQEAVVSHANAYSTPEVGRWRVAWLGVKDTLSTGLYDLKEDGVTAWTATITDDPVVTGSQNRLVTILGASFITDGVRPNDKVRVNFRLDPNSDVIYDEYTVDEVRTEESLVLTSSLASPINTPVKAQVVRVYTKDERATNIAFIGGEYNNRRVRVVFPDTYKSNGITKPGYVLAAAFAGLRSSVVPHQGLTNTEFLGADDLSKVVETFTQDQLNTMAEQGIWLATQEVVGATPYVRHQLTTANDSLNTSEDSITTNVDNISYGLKHALAPYIGKYNVNYENLLVVREAIIGELNFRATGTRTVRAGNQLTSFTPKDDILLLQINPNFKDRIDVEVRLNVPYPMNYINLKLIV